LKVLEVVMQERKAGGIGYLTGEWLMDPEKSTLVFIHGAGGHGYFWQAQMEALSDRANLVALDLPGHGRSDGSGKESIAEYARAVSEFLADIGAPNPVPCGFSLGGAIAQQLLMDFPQLYSAGILIGTGVRMEVGPIIFEAIEKDFSEFVDMLGKLAASRKTDPEKIRFFKDELSKSNPQVVSGDFRACDRFAAGAGLASIEVPVLIITAEDDILTPANLGDVLENKIQNTQRAHIMDAGHLMAIEKPEEINLAIIKFMDKCDL
jgi:pimeloyl-ACP methyl ester carboxylesterase